MTQEYEQGDAWYDDEKDREFRVAGADITYVVEVLREDEETGEIKAETVSYPQTSLTRKIEQDGLTPVGENQTDSDPADDAICPDCGESFASERGVTQHQRQTDCGDE